MIHSNNKQVVCFGEVLWDLLPSGKIAGGAPMNVAYQVNNLGAAANMISRVGADDLGKELCLFLETKGINTAFIQEDEMHPTGTVVVSLDEKGSPSYEIIKPVAWDYITLERGVMDLVKEADAFIYGSLAARETTSRATLLQLLEHASLKVFDVNLRVPFYTKSLVEDLLAKANIVKMNDEEVETIYDWYYTEAKVLKEKAQILRDRFALQILIVTLGPDGAMLLSPKEVVRQGGTPVRVQDTIGSGDAFLAGFTTQYLQEKSLEECLRFAVATGAFVATHKGGTAEISPTQIEELIKNGENE